MNDYQAPLEEMRFLLDHLVDLPVLRGIESNAELSDELIDAILQEGGRFAAEVLAPLNHAGDQEGVTFAAKGVQTPAGFREAYKQLVAAGWNSVALPQAWGGQGLPRVLSSALNEIFMSANKALMMCPGLTQGAVEALLVAADETLKATYVPRLVSGEWAGTMNLTEPQAGSDVGAIRTRAEPRGDGSYRLFGQKIYITFGEHDLTENIVHLVLARLPEAPPGAKGISLFVVPKFLVEADGRLGARNDLACTGIESKLGIHASPTCTMAYGEGGGAVGFLVGEPNQGLRAMFIMMNHARLTVGMEGLALAERAFQQALAYARERLQGRNGRGEPVAIIAHPEVRRSLLDIKSQIDAMRALSFMIAERLDLAADHPDPAIRLNSQAVVDLLTPIYKGWASETGVRLTTQAIGVHGGMGYIEETGVAQYLRDAVISTIYEGTTAIQASDLVGRKLSAVGRATLETLLGELHELIEEGAAGGVLLPAQAQLFERALGACEACIAHVSDLNRQAPAQALAVSVPLLMLMGKVMGGGQLLKSVVMAHRRKAMGGASPILQQMQQSLTFYTQHGLSEVLGLEQSVLHGAETVPLADDKTLELFT